LADTCRNESGRAPHFAVIAARESAFTEDRMKNIRLGSNFAVFVLFFGVAALEAFQTQNWPKALLWLGIGIVFLIADNIRRPRLNM
jgi:hypothetical protein